jgi:hypothetical protein
MIDAAPTARGLRSALRAGATALARQVPPLATVLPVTHLSRIGGASAGARSIGRRFCSGAGVRHAALRTAAAAFGADWAAARTHGTVTGRL